jgi:hypothetical protein
LAALLAILGALRRAAARDLSALDSLAVNNFFLFVALLVYGALNSGQPPKSAEPFFVLLGFLLLFPLSADPLGRIPKSRRALWPLDGGQRVALRLASLLLSPITWIAVLILLRAARPATALAFIAVSVGTQFAIVLSRRVAARAPAWNPLRHIPRLPGRLGALVRKDAREMLSFLDPYVAMALSAGGALYRWRSAHPDPAAFPIVGLLVALALSTYAQSLFALDGDPGMTRYRLLPLRGWQILLAKDIAFLVILGVLLLPLDPGPGITFGFAALAIGHHPSVLVGLPQQRWRFTGGRPFISALQMVGAMGLGFAEQEHRAVLLLSVALWCASLWYYGRRWDLRRLAT